MTKKTIQIKMDDSVFERLKQTASECSKAYPSKTPLDFISLLIEEATNRIITQPALSYTDIEDLLVGDYILGEYSNEECEVVNAYGEHKDSDDGRDIAIITSLQTGDDEEICKGGFIRTGSQNSDVDILLASLGLKGQNND